MSPDVRPGDWFCTSFPGAMLGTIINGVQRFYAEDGESELTHTGRVVDYEGTTFEALGRYRHQGNIWEAYGQEDTKLIIFRHDRMTPALADVAHKAALKRYRARFFKGKPDCVGYQGKIYPGWRLPMFCVKGIARVGFLKFEVCSEAMMFSLWYVGLMPFFRGWNPDMVTDHCVRGDRSVSVVYHQNIETYDPKYLDAGGER